MRLSVVSTSQHNPVVQVIPQHKLVRTDGMCWCNECWMKRFIRNGIIDLSTDKYIYERGCETPEDISALELCKCFCVMCISAETIEHCQMCKEFWTQMHFDEHHQTQGVVYNRKKK